MKLLFKIILIALVISIAVLGGAYWHLLSWLQQPIALPAPTVYEVPRGANWKNVAADLEQRGWIKSATELRAWLRLKQAISPLKAGEFLVQPGTTAAALIELLGSDKVLLHSFTLIEGSTFAELRQALTQQPTIKATLQNLSPHDIMSRLGVNKHPEGQFFPDTYHFPRGTTDLELLKMAQQRMQSELDKAWAERDANLPLQSKEQVLILASIVEKETGLSSERPMIAGVFIERLERGMRLETDPTVIYGLGERYDGNLRRVDLDTDGPYNTYRRKGLTPTPICMPGAAALQAAVRPQRTGALFFVATGDADRSHHFSKTYQEHLIYVQKLVRSQRRKR